MEEKKRFGKKSIAVIIAAAVLVAALGGFFAYQRKQSGNQAAENPDIVTVEKRTIVSSVSGTGTIEANSSQEVLSDLAGYRVASVNVSVGDIVNPGDIICVMDVSDVAEQRADVAESRDEAVANKAEQDADYDEQLKDTKANRKERLLTAQEDFQRAKKEYESARTDYENAKAMYDAERVKRDQADAEIASAQSAASVSAAIASASLAQAAANGTLNNNTTTTVTINGSTVTVPASTSTPYMTAAGAFNAAAWAASYTPSTSAMSEVELASLSAQVEQKRAAMTAAQTQMDTAEAQVRAIKSENTEDLEDAKENYDDAQQDAIDQYDDTIEDLNETIGKAIVYADIRGAVTELNVSEGRTFSGSTVAVIEGMGDYYVSASIDEYDVADVSVGMSVVMKTDATRDEELTGQVTYVAVKASEATGAGSALSGLSSFTGGSDISSYLGGGGGSDATYEIHISLDRQNDRLRLGMNVQVSVITEEADEVLAVPYEAIQTREDGSRFIEVVADDTGEELETREIDVEVGLEGAYYSQLISDEVKEGMRAVVPKDESGTSVDELLDMVGNAGGV